MAERLAILIDGENICGEIADELFARVSGLGQPVVRRVYGNFAGSQATTWLGPIVRHGIVAQQVSGSKNAADFALTIDAMHFLHSIRLDGFCIVSCDKDFTLLATRIRETGADVFGFGKRSTSESYRVNCTQFFVMGDTVLAQQQPKDHPATELIFRALKETAIDADGWAELGAIGNAMQKLKPNYKQIYKCGRLYKLVNETRAFVLSDDNKRIQILKSRDLKLAS